MILVASNSFDLPTVQPVVDLLVARDEHVLLYLADQVAAGKVPMSMTLDGRGAVGFVYGDISFRPDEIRAAWYRRPNVFTADELNHVNAVFMKRQRKECQDSLWYSIPDNVW